MRVNSKRGTRMTNEIIKRAAHADPTKCDIYWACFKSWVFNHKQGRGVLRVRPFFQWSPGFKGGLYLMRLELTSEYGRPNWFPEFDKVNPDVRNFLHMSIIFHNDIYWMDANEQAIANGHIQSLQNDPAWNGTEYVTYVSYVNLGSGSFHLAGFNDPRINWLHSRGTYRNRSVGHVALYAGGI